MKLTRAMTLALLIGGSIQVKAAIYLTGVQVPAITTAPDSPSTADTQPTALTSNIAPSADAQSAPASESPSTAPALESPSTDGVQATAPDAEVTPNLEPQALDPTPVPVPAPETTVLKEAADDASISPTSQPALGKGLISILSGTLILILLAISAGLLLYMLPTLIARSRRHRNIFMITFLNFFTGWTLLGWIGCLVWAVANPGLSTPIPLSRDSSRG